MQKFLLSSLVVALMLGSDFSTAENKPRSVVYRDLNPDLDFENPGTNNAWEHLVIPTERYDSPYRVSLFNPQNGEDSRRLWSQTKAIAGYGLGVAGALALMPEEITNWDDDGEKLLKKWGDNVSEVMTWDRDAWYINYIGHPYFGGVYYQAARKSGYRQWDSFMYSFMMSTFYWEYGIEAFAEVPALQDLVVTPVLGWVVGEWAFQREQEILKNGGELWGSSKWGSTVLFLLDPVDSIGVWINNKAGRRVVRAGTGYISYDELPEEFGATKEGNKSFRVGVTFTLDQSPEPLKQLRYREITGDPVDAGIVGLSLGAAHVSLDSDWSIDSGAASDWTLGLYFNKRVSARLRYTHAKLETSVKAETYENYGVDVQYYFNTDSKTRPYVTGGVGEQIFDKDRDRKNVIWNAGVGLHHQINPKLAIQADVLAAYSPSQHTTEEQFNVRFVYRFGSGEHPGLP